MMITRKLLAVCAVPLLGLAWQAPVGAQSLKEAVEQTIKTNPEVLITTSRRLSADQDVKQARGGYFPKIDANLGYGRERSENSNTGFQKIWLTRREAGLSLTQMLFDGFGVKSEVERQQARSDAAAHRVFATSDDIGLRAVEAYLEVLRHRELFALAQKNLEAHERTNDQIKLRAGAGVGRKADQDQTEGRLALAKANLRAEQSNLRDAEISFIKVVGQPPKEITKPESPEQAMPKTDKEAMDKAYEGHPQLKAAMVDVEQAIAQHNAAKSLLWPRLDLEVGATNNHDVAGVQGVNGSLSAMLRLRYNLFHGGSDQAQVDSRGYQIQEAKSIADRTRRQVEENMNLSWNAFLTAHERLPALKQHVDSTELSRDAYEKQFAVGQRTLLDLLDSENELFTARNDYVNGLYTELFGMYRVLNGMGTLLSTLQVTLPPEATLAAK